MATTEKAPKPGIPYRRLRTVNPELNLPQIKILKAMYKGGCDLLRNTEVMSEVFPKYAYELDNVYSERKKRAFYENMFAMSVNQVSAGLAQDQCRFEPKKNDGDEDDFDLGTDPEDLPPPQPPVVTTVPPKPPTTDDDEGDDKKPAPGPTVVVTPPPPPPVKPKPIKEIPKLDPYWQDLMENATAITDDESGQRGFDQVIRDCVVEALVTGWGWLQCDLPEPPDPDDPYYPTSTKEQEDAGLLRAYVCQWPTDQVIDWQTKNGKLLWVRTYECESISETPYDDRSTVTHTWTDWDAEGWTKYQFVQDIKNGIRQQMPNDDVIIPVADEGPHSFKRVPWSRLNLSTGDGARLHLGDMIESLCRNYFNRQNGEAFQWSQYFYQQLYEFLGPEVSGIDTIVSESQQDPSRAHRRRAPGTVHVRGAGDRAEYVGPDMAGADVGRLANQDSRDAILRVTAQMALAQDTSGAMLRRSADSKRQDSVAQEIILGAIGKRALAFACGVAKMLQVGRGEDIDDLPDVCGYSRFNIEDASDVITQTALLQTIKLPSARAQIEVAYQAFMAALGDNATSEMLAEVRMQLEKAITQDQIMRPPMPTPPPIAQKLQDEDPEEKSPDDEQEEEDAETKNPGQKKAPPFGKGKPE